MNDRMIDKLRKICLAMPDVTEASGHGHPVFRVGKKPFCSYHGWPGDESVAVKVALPLYDSFLRDERFFKTPHVARYGWISFKKTARMPAAELKGLLEGSYALAAAPKPRKPTSR